MNFVAYPLDSIGFFPLVDSSLTYPSFSYGIGGVGTRPLGMESNESRLVPQDAMPCQLDCHVKSLSF